MPRWRRATVVWLRPDATRPDLAYLPFEHVNTDMIYATTVTEIVARHKAFVRKWRLKCPAVAASLEEAGARLLHYPPEQWKSLRTTNAVERLHEEFKRRIKTQCVLPCAETAAMLFWALLASGQITLRKVDGWQSLAQAPGELDLAA
jgi:putative transposase